MVKTKMLTRDTSQMMVAFCKKIDFFGKYIYDLCLKILKLAAEPPDFIEYRTPPFLKRILYYMKIWSAHIQKRKKHKELPGWLSGCALRFGSKGLKFESDDLIFIFAQNLFFIKKLHSFL